MPGTDLQPPTVIKLIKTQDNFILTFKDGHKELISHSGASSEQTSSIVKFIKTKYHFILIFRDGHMESIQHSDALSGQTVFSYTYEERLTSTEFVSQYEEVEWEWATATDILLQGEDVLGYAFDQEVMASLLFQSQNAVGGGSQ